MSEGINRKLKQAVIEGLPEDAAMHANKALTQGFDPLDCINEGLTPGIKRVGELFASGEYFLPELIIGADGYAEDAISVVDFAFKLADAPR